MVLGSYAKLFFFCIQPLEKLRITTGLSNVYVGRKFPNDSPHQHVSAISLLGRLFFNRK